MIWQLSYRADPFARAIADRHYNRQKSGTPQFVPPGRCLVLVASNEAGRALWITSWPFGEYVKHRWPGAWVCSAFRNEGAGAASALILEAVAATRWRYGAAPSLGMVTFLDRDKVKPVKERGRPTWGWTWLKAGFEPDGETQGGLLAMRLSPDRMPLAHPPIGAQYTLQGID